MVHSICITFNYDRSDNTGSWVWVNNLSKCWEFIVNDTKYYTIPKTKGYRALIHECKKYWDDTAWIKNLHENRR